jgi:hypothetical protein
MQDHGQKIFFLRGGGGYFTFSYKDGRRISITMATILENKNNIPKEIKFIENQSAG